MFLVRCFHPDNELQRELLRSEKERKTLEATFLYESGRCTTFSHIPGHYFGVRRRSPRRPY